MSKKSKFLSIAALIFGSAMTLPALAAAPSIFYACQKDGKVIPGTIQIDSKPKCSGGATMVWWEQRPAVSTFGGVVASDGSVLSGTGFTVQRASAGIYQITFASGVVNKDATLSVTPYGITFGYVNPVVTGAVDMGNGSRLYEIRLSATTPGEMLADNPFMFIVAQPAY
jgi:hypothetical protein